MITQFHKYLAFIALLSTNSFFAQEKPNILWITIEDTSPQFIGCYGNGNASTPNIDKLAKEGIRFTNAFSTGTVCSPSRSAIITGVPTYKTGTGNHRSNYPIPNFIKGFPYFLKKAGYYTSNNVKTDYNIANEKKFIAETWNESSNTASWSGRETKNQPFFSVFNFADSHQSRTMSNSFEWYKKYVWNYLPKEDRIGDNDFDMPPFYKDTPAMRKQFARVYNSIKLTDNKIGKLLEKLDKDNLTENTIIFFFADHGEGIPRGKTNGINLGYRVPFIVKFPKKYQHLSPWGKKGLTTDELVNFEDLAPTIINLANAKTPKYLKGRTLIGKKRDKEQKLLLLSSDRADNGPDLVRTITDGQYVYSRNFMPFMPEARYIRYLEIADITQQMRKDLKNGELNQLQKSIFATRSTEILYDIENDIWETENLVHNSAYKSILKKMRKALHKRVIKSNDVLFAPEYEIGLISKETTPYEFRQASKNYPIKEIYNAALVSGKKGGKNVKKLSELLKHKHKIVRYWAIIGFMNQDVSTQNLYKAELIEALQDSYAPVKITAAAILYDKFADKQSEKILIAFSKHNNMDLALLTINYLLYVTNKTPFIATIRGVHKMPNRNYNVKVACMDFLSILNLVQSSDKGI